MLLLKMKLIVLKSFLNIVGGLILIENLYHFQNILESGLIRKIMMGLMLYILLANMGTLQC